ncbi:glycosyltransferase family 2 protein [Roseobacter sp.]|uniref:glycosyltransferase family 2 protein n=1 Tax=Roseobacter sp. TaxID=1907202 RepID=UPI00385C35A8
MKVFAVIPVHNRKNTTLKMLSSLAQISRPQGVDLSVCVIDDGSTDGTFEAIKKAHPEIEVHRSDGNLFWSGAVRLGIDHFLQTDATHLWLLNDDLTLDPHCLSHMVKAATQHSSWVVSATVLDRDDKLLYGGIFKLPFFRFRKATDDDFENGVCHADTVNGNCLLISREALLQFRLPAQGLYRQEALDMYIGLEATRLGKRPMILRNATCNGEANTTKFWFYAATSPVGNRLRALMGPKGLPPKMYWDFCRKFAGPLAPFYFVRPYARVLLTPKSKPRAVS